MEKLMKAESKQAAGPAVSVPAATGLSREELKARFAAKLEFLKKQRGIAGEVTSKTSAKKEQRQKKLAAKKAKKATTVQGKKGPDALTKTAPVVAEDGKQIFSKFDFGMGQADRKAVTPKNPKQALQKLLSREEKINKLAAVDQTKAEALKKSDAWSKAIQKAQGAIVKDDARLLKRSIAKNEKAKEKRSDGWNKREKDVKESQMNRQKKRQENIDNRKMQKKNGGGTGGPGGKKQPQKKRPGFEGGFFKKKVQKPSK